MAGDLSDAVFASDVEAAKPALDNGADVNAPIWEHDETALILAAQLGDEPMVCLLLEAGADIEARLRGRTALWSAPVMSPVFDLLLERGANLHARDYDGRTKLIEIISSAPPMEAVQKLINCGIDPGMQDDGGETALSLARYFGFVALIELLEKIAAAR